MTRPVRIYLVVAALAGVSLGLKALLDVPVDYDKLHPAIMTTIHKALQDKGFQPLAQTDTRAVTAFRGACFVWIGPSKPEGGGDSAFIADYGGLGRVSYWYRGKISPALTKVAALPDRYFERTKVAFGLEPRVHPVYHIVSSSECSDDELAGFRLEELAPDAGS